MDGLPNLKITSYSIKAWIPLWKSEYWLLIVLKKYTSSDSPCFLIGTVIKPLNNDWKFLKFAFTSTGDWPGVVVIFPVKAFPIDLEKFKNSNSKESKIFFSKTENTSSILVYLSSERKWSGVCSLPVVIKFK